MIYDLVNNVVQQADRKAQEPILDLSAFLWCADDARVASELLSALAAEKIDERLRATYEDIVSLAYYDGLIYLIDSGTDLWSLREGVLSVHSVGWVGCGDSGHVLDLVQDKDTYIEHKEYFDSFLTHDYIDELCEAYDISDDDS